MLTVLATRRDVMNGTQKKSVTSQVQRANACQNFTNHVVADLFS